MNGTEQVLAALDILNGEGFAGDAYVSQSRSTELSVVDGKLDKQQTEENQGIGIRVFTGDRVGFSYTTVPSVKSIEDTVRRAAALARFLPEDLETLLPRKSSLTRSENFPDASGGELSTAEKIELVHEIEQAARNVDRRVSRFQLSSYLEVEGRVAIGNTNGVQSEYGYRRVYGSCECAAEDGEDAQVGWGSAWGRTSRSLDPGKIGAEAGYRAVEKLGAQPWTTLRTNIVLDPATTSGLVSAIANAFRADEVLRRKSLFGGRLGEKVASSLVTVVDDGWWREGSASAPCDDEGVPTGRTVLIDQGILSGFLQDTSSARRMDTVSTGSAWRESYTSPPKIGPSNFYIVPGNHSCAELLEKADRGLLITETMGLHTIDTVTGEFSLAASGVRIENGQRAGAVTGVAIAGNLNELLAQVAAVGADLRTFAGGGVGCSLLVEGITVAGN